jgi:hypothetical protein
MGSRRRRGARRGVVVIDPGPFEVVTKLDAAKRQLAIAIELCLDERDTVSTRTLAAAAHEIYRTLLRRKGRHGSGVLDNPLMSPAMQKRVTRGAALPRNFFKHADRDWDRILRFRPLLTEALIFDAVVMQHDLAGGFSPEGRVFFCYFVATHEAEFSGDFPFLETARKLKAEISEFTDKRLFALVLRQARHVEG